MAKIKIKIQGLDRAEKKFSAGTRERVLLNAMDLSGIFLAGKSKKDYLSGPRPKKLGVRTGRLRSSITSGPTVKRGTTYINRIGTNVKYGPVHEFGTKPYDILPRTANVLRFVIGGNVIFAKKVHHPGNKPRPFLRPVIEDKTNQETVSRIITNRIERAIEATQ